MFGEKLLETVMYSSKVDADENNVLITLQKDGAANGED